jgi:hypothetical protein
MWDTFMSTNARRVREIFFEKVIPSLLMSYGLMDG